MKYYSKKESAFLITVNMLMVAWTIFYAFATYMISGMASAYPPNYNEMVLDSILKYCIPMLGFIILSFIIILLQQYKNYRWGYLAILAIFSDIYIVKINFWIIELIQSLSSMAFWLLISVTMLSAVLIPFYVLGKLIKRDLSERKRIYR